MVEDNARILTNLKCSEEICNSCGNLGMAVEWDTKSDGYEALCLKCIAGAIEKLSSSVADKLRQIG